MLRPLYLVLTALATCLTTASVSTKVLRRIYFCIYYSPEIIFLVNAKETQPPVWPLLLYWFPASFSSLLLLPIISHIPFSCNKWLIYPYFRTWVFPPWKTLTHHFPDYSQFPNYYILKFLDNAHAIVSPFSVVCLPKSDVVIWNISFTTKNFLKEYSFRKRLDWTILSFLGHPWSANPSFHFSSAHCSEKHDDVIVADKDTNSKKNLFFFLLF